ncbi:MAG: dihydropteroate synthase [Candidatus Hodarchaeaceae archaeon]|nr:dihydropteroate synthase [Candidatus Hodarchaeaceae archaeon]
MRRADLAGVRVGDDGPVVIIGALNIGPESFYRGSVVRGEGEVIERAGRMLEEGASIIDIGAMSTAPGIKPISASLERRRLIPVIKALAKELDAPISVDTQRAIVAEAALEAGAGMVNDVSGLKADPRMARVIADFKCSAVLMAARQRPGDARTVDEIRRALEDSLRICERHGIEAQKIAVDPGIGFGKGAEWDLYILANLNRLKALGRPICVAVSRKFFIGHVLNLPDPADRLWGSLAATAIAVLNGADVVRTHDPKETSHAIRVAEAVRSGKNQRLKR